MQLMRGAYEDVLRAHGRFWSGDNNCANAVRQPILNGYMWARMGVMDMGGWTPAAECRRQ